MVQNSLGPLDRMPGLQVGQRWESRVVSPLHRTGRAGAGRGRAQERDHLGRQPGHDPRSRDAMPPVSVRTWVRPDGLVLRQEVPFPFVRLVLERLPQRLIGAERARGRRP